MRSKVVVVTLISLFFMKTVRSQSDDLLVQGQTGNLYLQHTVVAKENWYSIGRLYNLSAKELALYNKLTMTQPLSIGQALQIPLTAVNFSQNGIKAAGESLVPLYYVIQEKEWMYRISVNHNKVPIASLEKWNNINKDQVRAGMQIIVGYLKVKTALSALATRTGGSAVATSAAGKPEGGGTTAPPVGKTTSVAAPDSGKTVNPPVKTPAVTTPPVSEKPATTPANTPATTGSTPATTSSTPATTGGGIVKPVSATGKFFNGGYFKSDFSDGGKSTSGQAGTFKSTSGWQDGKYYALMNNIPVGTIVKVTGGASGKSIYAKVLGQLPDMKESAGLTIRISNAAASELGEGDGKFNVDVRY